MFGITFLLIPFIIVFSIIKYIFEKNKSKILRFVIKVKKAMLDNEFMTNLSMGVFVGSLVGLIATSNIVVTFAYLIATIITFIAMIDYNYKKRL